MTLNVKEFIIGCDHAGFELKTYLKTYYESLGFQIKDVGTYSIESVDYPDFAHPVALGVEKGKYKIGILVCGSGNGVCITANKHEGVRAALCWNNEISELARKHNNANIVCLPARFINSQEAIDIVNTFLNTSFEGGRHENRIKKIPL